MLGRAQDPHTNGAWLSKLTECNMKCLSLDRQLIRKQEGMVEWLGEMRKRRRERIEKETKR